MSKEYSPAVEMMAAQMSERATIRKRWKDDAGDLIDAHMLAFSSVCSMIERFSGRRFPQQSRSIEGRMSLSAQFLQGVEICETTISEGLYSHAAALLKQELETLAAVDEFENNRRRDGKTPNIGNGAMRGFRPIYGDLNNIAHVSWHDMARELVTIEQGIICAPTLIPQYNHELAKFLYGIHVHFIIEIGRQTASIFNEIFGEGHSEEEENWTVHALLILLKKKVIELPPDLQDRFPNVDFGASS